MRRHARLFFSVAGILGFVLSLVLVPFASSAAAADAPAEAQFLQLMNGERAEPEFANHFIIVVNVDEQRLQLTEASTRSWPALSASNTSMGIGPKASRCTCSSAIYAPGGLRTSPHEPDTERAGSCPPH